MAVHQNCCHQMCLLGSKYAKDAFVARALPWTPLGVAYNAPVDL